MLYIAANMCEQSADAEHIQVMLRTSFEKRHEINIAAGAYDYVVEIGPAELYFLLEFS